MTIHAPGTAPSTTGGPRVLPGTPVVPGVAWGPVVRPSGAVALPGDDGAVVAEEERAAELARMMAGLETTDSALAHAGELVELAASSRRRS